MANEIRLSASLVYDDATSEAEALQVPELLASVAATVVTRQKVTVGLAERTVPPGDVTTRGWCLCVNRSTTGTIHLLTGSGGVRFAKLLPGEFALFRVGSGVAELYATASEAGCKMDYLLIDT